MSVKGRRGVRWGFLDGFQILPLGKLQIDRLRILSTPLCSVMLHRIHGPDPDRYPHDHPWPFLSIVLSGWYTEVVYTSFGSRDNSLRVHDRFSVHHMRRTWAHRITAVDGVLWTLVFTGPHYHTHRFSASSGWGFWTDAGWVPWREYCDSGRETSKDA